jgi:hypothetical protein
MTGLDRRPRRSTRLRRRAHPDAPALPAARRPDRAAPDHRRWRESAHPRFVRPDHYANPTADLTNLDWYTGLHATRVLIDLVTWHKTGDPRANAHPWTLIAPGGVTELTRITGIGLTRPSPVHQVHANRR